MIKEAAFYDTLDEGKVICLLCPAKCRLKPGRRGICRSRFNDNGRLVTDNFGETVTIAIDPIEKKPLYHFYPTADIISIGPNGCNLSCSHCQNWQISQANAATVFIAPEQLPDVASRDGSVGVSYTYTEPIIWYEYIMETAPLIRLRGMVNVMVSNGYINPEPLEKLLSHIDAFNIDLKGMRPEFYRRVCKGHLEPVLDVIRQINASGSHLEVTNLIIPDLNDGDDDFRQLGEFMASVNPAIPLHLSAYHPSYRLEKPRTPVSTMRRAYSILKDYVTHVFVGNMEIAGCSDTYCPACGHVLIERSYYRVQPSGLDENGHCRHCGAESGVIVSKGPR